MSLREALQATQSNAQTVRKPAEAFLRENEASANFTTGLFQAATTQQVYWDSNTRLIALLYFKNHVCRHWGQNYGIKIPIEEKQQLIEQIFQLLDQTGLEKIVVEYLAAVVAAIFMAAQDEQRKQLLARLLPAPLMLSPSSAAAFSRATVRLTIFKPLIKEWSSTLVRAWGEDGPDPVLQQAAPALVSAVLPFLEGAVAAAHTCVGPMLEPIRVACVCLRDVLRGAQHASCDGAAAVVRQLFSVFELLQPATRSSAAGMKGAAAVGKCLAAIVKVQPHALVGGGSELEAYLEAACANLGHPVLAGPCMHFLAAVLSCPEYQLSPAERCEAYAAAERCVSAFFNQKRVAQICEHLITAQLMVQPGEIELWGNDPEALVLGTGVVQHDANEFRELQSAESLMRELLVSKSHYAVPAVLGLYNSAGTSVNATDTAILTKDACLHAVGLAASRLGTEVGLSEWVESLAEDLEVHGKLMMVLHRRIIWLVGEVAVALTSEVKVEFAQLLFQYVQGSSIDRVVRLTAAVALAAVLEAITSADPSAAVSDACAMDKLDIDTLLCCVLDVFADVECVSLRKRILLAICALMKAHVQRVKRGKRAGVAVSSWKGLKRIVLATPVLLNLVGDEAMVRPCVVDIVEQIMLLSEDWSLNFTMAAPLIRQAFTTVQGRSKEATALRQSTLSLWHTMTSVAPPVEHVNELLEISLQLLAQTSCLEPIEMPPAMRVLTNAFVIGGPQLAQTRGHDFVSALMAIAHSDHDPHSRTHQHRFEMGRALNILASILPEPQAAQALMPLFQALVLQSDGRASSYWKNLSFQYTMVQAIMRLAYRSRTEIVLPIIEQLACTIITRDAMLKTFFEHLARTRSAAPRMMAAAVCSKLLPCVPTEPRLQPFTQDIIVACVQLTVRAVAPAALAQGFTETANCALQEIEHRLLLGNLAEQAHAIPPMIVWQLQQFADVIGHEFFEQSFGSQPSVVENIRALSAAFAMHSCCTSPT